MRADFKVYLKRICHTIFQKSIFKEHLEKVIGDTFAPWE